MTLLPKLFLFLVLSCTSQVKSTENSITSKVIGIKDGDTIEILHEGKPLIIRFAHVDCPEIRKGQPFGTAAKKFTSDLCFGRMITVLHEGKYDRYKRLIAVIINEKNENVNKELVRAGLAWHFKKYSTDESYDKLEKIARLDRKGLWVENNPTPPWDWRKPR